MSTQSIDRCRNCKHEVSEKDRECSLCKKELSEVGREINIVINERIRVYDILGLKKFGDKPNSKDHRAVSETLVGKRIGRDGKVAYVHQVIDREKNYYKKYVKQ